MASSLVAGSFAHSYPNTILTLGAAVQVGDVICFSVSGTGSNTPTASHNLAGGGHVYAKQLTVTVGSTTWLHLFTAPVTVAGTTTITATGGTVSG